MLPAFVEVLQGLDDWSLRPDLTWSGGERGGLFVTHTDTDTERTLRRARSILHERLRGRLVPDVKTIQSRHGCDRRWSRVENCVTICRCVEFPPSGDGYEEMG